MQRTEHETFLDAVEAVLRRATEQVIIAPILAARKDAESRIEAEIAGFAFDNRWHIFMDAGSAHAELAT
ncbi:MAG TPA: hypothetical protein VKT32_12855 [Chthonomonadaceae bacterium]|nr:hypothetical protein [Chthonomonadaceae bacterium]